MWCAQTPSMLGSAIAVAIGPSWIQNSTAAGSEKFHQGAGVSPQLSRKSVPLGQCRKSCAASEALAMAACETRQNAAVQAMSALESTRTPGRSRFSSAAATLCRSSSLPICCGLMTPAGSVGR